MTRRMRCPECGHEDLQILRDTTTTTTGKNYSGTKGCLGFLMFGPLGLLCGTCGQGQRTQTTNTTYWVCAKCGHKFRDPDDWRAEVRNILTGAYVIMGLGGVVFLMMLLLGSGVKAFIPLIIFIAGGFLMILGAAKEENKIYQMEEHLNGWR